MSKPPAKKTPARKAPARSRAPAKTPKAPDHRSRAAVVVLGMHRSGTSALAGVLNLMGCDVPATLMAMSESNPKGYFESVPLYEMHSRLLSSAGSRWDDWLPLNPGWYRSTRAEEFHERAVQVLGEEFGTARLFVLKDPRICRLLPFWEDVLKTADVAPHYVLTHRNPLEVAASLEKRDGMDPGTGLLLWLRHVLDAEADSRGQPRSFVNYAGLLENWAGVMQKIQDDTGLVLPRMGVAAAQEVEQFLDSNLRRNAESPVRVLENPLLSDWVRDTYEIMERWVAKGESRADHKTLDAIRAGLTGAGTTFAPVIEASRKTASALKDARAAQTQAEEELSQVAEARDKATAERKALTAERDAARAQTSEVARARDSLQAERDQAQKDRTHAQHQREAAVKERDALQAQRDTLTRERDAARKETEAARAQVTTLTSDLEKARAEATAARSQVENLTAAYEAAQTRADELQSRTVKLELDLDHATQQREALEGARSDLEQHLTDVAGERDKIRARIKTLETEQADAETARAGLSAEVDRLEAEKDSAAEKIDALEAALAQSKSALAQREEETDQLHSELGRLREEHDAQLEQLEAETGTLRHQLSERVVQVSTLESRSKNQSTEVARITAMLLEAEEALANAETRAEARLADLTAQNEGKLKRLQERSKAQQAEAEARIAELKSRGDYAEAAYESIRHSTSWRITRPLRAVIRSLRGR